MKIDGAIASDHRDPWSKGGAISERVQLSVSVQKDVLDQIINFGARHTSEENAVHERRVEFIQTSEAVAVAVEHRCDQRNFNRRPVSAALGSVLRGLCLGAH